MRFVLFILTITVFCGMNIVLAEERFNLVKNGSFEKTNGKNVPKGWSLWGARVEPDKTQVKDGSTSLRIDGNKEDYMACVCRLKVVDPFDESFIRQSHTYELTGWVRKGIGVRTEKTLDKKSAWKKPFVALAVHETLEGKPLDPLPHYWIVACGEPEKWEKLFLTFTTSNDLKTLTIICYNVRGGGPVWFDKISLREKQQ